MKTFTRRQALKAGVMGIAAAALVSTPGKASAESTKDKPLRRKERELNQEQTLEVIENTEWAVLSTADTDGNPYGVPVSPVMIGNTLYFHGTGLPGGRKTDNMLMNPNVSLCFVAKANVLPEWYSIDFASAVVTGKAYPVEDTEEQKMVMKHVLARFAPHNSEERNTVQEHFRMPLVLCWKVVIEQITGKARGSRKWVKGESVHTVQDMGPSSWLVDIPQ